MSAKIFGILCTIFVTYSCYTYIGYSETLRNSKYFLVLGLSISLISNLLWLWGVRLLNQSQGIFWYGISFDVIVTACSLYVPIVLSKVKFNSLTWLGVGLVLSGLFVIKNFGVQE
ncbi:MAG TPA: hypothetical protein PL182_10435 [Pseudobdellovibrionaceae bacterium]|nr:hypothetical protein [Pseudobdellovibrionaceae bacterium]